MYSKLNQYIQTLSSKKYNKEELKNKSMKNVSSLIKCSRKNFKRYTQFYNQEELKSQRIFKISKLKWKIIEEKLKIRYFEIKTPLNMTKEKIRDLKKI